MTKTILVPTDYSEISRNAVEYALHLAREERAGILLYHVFHVPLPSHDTPVPIADYPGLEKAEEEKMQKFAVELKKFVGGQVKIRTRCVPGFVQDEINNYCEQKDVHLVVMGISGGGPLKEFFAGSNALGVARHCKSDVLIVPAKAKFRAIKKISLATDLEDLNVEKVSGTLKHYCQLFNARAILVNIKDAFTIPSEERVITREKMMHTLEEVHPTFVQPYHEDASEAIDIHVRIKHSDWLAVVHKDYGFFKNLFHKSLTKELAFHTEVPILSISQREEHSHSSKH
jgi:nucleotide-binding universal stress UspA family protein